MVSSRLRREARLARADDDDDDNDDDDDDRVDEGNGQCVIVDCVFHVPVVTVNVWPPTSSTINSSSKMPYDRPNAGGAR